MLKGADLCPKTSAFGGLPNIISEPRKPVDLGSMYQDSVECITGIFVHHNIVQAPTQQWREKYLNLPTKAALPKKEIILYHTAKVPRQAENSKVVPGGWVGGDAWFGLINTCVELKSCLDVFSSFIVKQNTNYFPKRVLHALL